MLSKATSALLPHKSLFYSVYFYNIFLRILKLRMTFPRNFYFLANLMSSRSKITGLGQISLLKLGQIQFLLLHACMQEATAWLEKDCPVLIKALTLN